MGRRPAPIALLAAAAAQSHGIHEMMTSEQQDSATGGIENRVVFHRRS
jgi:hypothetical protein